jgi:hypothetical protein
MDKPINKFIKTECGINEYHRLKILSKKNIFYKIRFYWFVSIATLRDYFKN